MKFGAPLAVALAANLIACSSNKAETQSSDLTTDAGGTTSPVDGAALDPSNPCNIKSGYEGDENCILPPSAEEGIQIHAGPKNYDDPDEVAAYLLPPGSENVECFNAPIADSDFFFLRQENRMRPHSHHMLIFAEKGDSLQEGLAATGCDIATAVGTIPGSQTPRRSFPDKLGPEDQGAARYLPQSTMAGFQLHYINNTPDPVLREAWINLYRMPESEVKQRFQSIFMVGDIAANIPANSKQTTTLNFQPNLTDKIRVFELNAHMHAHAEAFTAWKIHDGKEEIVYQSFNWEDPLENTFNSVVKNPEPNATARQDGGLSGLLYLEPGDTLRWACDVNNTTAKPLHFANEALTAEMCMIVGSYISDTPGLMSGLCTQAPAGTTRASDCAAGLGAGRR